MKHVKLMTRRQYNGALPMSCTIQGGVTSSSYEIPSFKKFLEQKISSCSSRIGKNCLLLKKFETADENSTFRTSKLQRENDLLRHEIRICTEYLKELNP